MNAGHLSAHANRTDASAPTVAGSHTTSPTFVKWRMKQMAQKNNIKIRIVGTPDQVEAVASRIRTVFVDTYQSESQVRSRRTKAHVLRYITLKTNQ